MNQNKIEDLGSQVPAICSHPDCGARITRGRVNVCGADPAGGNGGCGMPFCGAHLQGPKQTCECCAAGVDCFPPKEGSANWADWLDFKLTGGAWAQWRAANPEEVAKLVQQKIAAQEAQNGAQ